MGHFHQQACPLMFQQSQPVRTASDAPSTPAEGAPAPGSVIAPEVPTLTSQPEDIPLMQRSEVQHAAIHSPHHDLPQLIRKEINAGHCPACRYKCVSNRYLARHAQLQHPTFKQTDSLVRQWAQSRGGVGQPCRWHLFQLGLRSSLALAMVEDAEPSRARQELTQFEGHFRDTPVPPPASRENPPHSSQAAESREASTASTASTAKEPTAMDDRTQSKSTRQTETAEEEAGPPTKWSRPGGKGEGHGEQDRDKETDKHHIQEDDPQEIQGPPSQPHAGQGLKAFFQVAKGRGQPVERMGRLGPPRSNGRQGAEGAHEGVVPPGIEASGHHRLPPNGPGLHAVPEDLNEAEAAGRGIVNNLYKTAQAWHAKKSSDPDSLTNTLRTTLVYCMMTTLQERITALETSQEDVRRLESLGIMENGCFLYMRWNQERKCHEKTQQEHLTLAQAKEHVAVIVKHLVFPRVVLRFHALRKLTSEMASEVVPFTLEIHNRCLESQHTYSAFERLAFNSVMHLIGGSLRPSKLGRSPLEKAIEEAACRL